MTLLSLSLSFLCKNQDNVYAFTQADNGLQGDFQNLLKFIF